MDERSFQNPKLSTALLIAYKAAADVAGKSSLFVVTVVAARLMSPEAFGIFSLGTTLGWMLAVVTDSGIQLHVARAIARRPSEAPALVGAWLRVRLWIAAAAVLVVAGGAAIAGWRSSYALPLTLFAIVYACSGLVEFLHYVYRGLSRTDIESSLTLWHRGAMLVCAIVTLASTRSVTALAVAMLVPAAATLLVSLRIARTIVGRPEGLHYTSGTMIGEPEGPRYTSGTMIGEPEGPHYTSGTMIGEPDGLRYMSGTMIGEPDGLRYTSGTMIGEPDGLRYTSGTMTGGPDGLRSTTGTTTGGADGLLHASRRGVGRQVSLSAFGEVWPIGAGIVLSALYFRIDVFLVQHWSGTEAVGLYNAVFRLVDALRLFPAAVMAVALPSLCRGVDLRPLARAAAPMTLAAAAAAMVLWAAAGWLIPMIYQAHFGAAVPAFRILLLSFPLMTLNMALTHQLVAWDRQGAYAALCGGALAVNLALNARLIPALSIDGAAWATVGTEIFLTSGCALVLARLKGSRSVSRATTSVPRHSSPSLQREGGAVAR